MIRYLAYEFRVSSVTPFKIDENKNQSRSIKSRIWETKEGKYAKPLDKIQVTAIFLKEDMRRNVTQIYRDLFGDAMLVSIQIGSNMAAENQQIHLSLRFATKE